MIRVVLAEDQALVLVLVLVRGALTALPEIAAELGLSEGAGRNGLSEAIGKLGAQNRIEAARVARNKGWL